ncbi:hypothetical protein UlMin_035254 [Ulmus minor]
MAKSLLLLALFMLPALALANRPLRTPFVVQGKVFCDTCRAGFETTATTYIPGAKVRVECRTRSTMELCYSKEVTTDSTGNYKLSVDEDHEDQICDATVVSSSQANCAKAVPGRNTARVILTGNNGIATNIRFANAIGFERNEPLAGCENVLKQYQETEYEN